MEILLGIAHMIFPVYMHLNCMIFNKISAGSQETYCIRDRVDVRIPGGVFVGVSIWKGEYNFTSL